MKYVVMQYDPLHMKIGLDQIQSGLASVKIHVHHLFPRHLVAHLKTRRSVQKPPWLATADYTFAQVVRSDPKTFLGKRQMIQMYQFQCHHYRSEEHTSELQSRGHLVCRLLLE